MRLQFLALLASRGFSSLLFLACNLILARNVSPDTFGIVSAVLAATTFFFVLTDFGFSTFVSRAEAKGHADDVARALRLNVLTSISGAAVAAVALLVLTNNVSSGAMALLGLALAFDKNSDTLLMVPIAQGDKTTPALALSLRRGVALLVQLVLLQISVDAVVGYCIALLAGAALSQSYVRWRVHPGPGAGTPHNPVSVWRRASPFFASNISAASRNLDIPIVTVVAGGSAGGLYAAAQRLTSPFMLIPGAVASLVLPAASKTDSRSARRIAYRLTVAHLVLLAGLAVASVFSSAIVELALGPDYSDAAPALAFTLLAFPFVALSSPLGGVLQSQHQEHVVARNGVIFAVLLIPAIAASAMLWGATGAAAALGAVYLMKCASLLVLIARRLTG